MLSIPSKMGLSSSIMPQSVLLLITTDEDLENQKIHKKLIMEFTHKRKSCDWFVPIIRGEIDL